MSTIAAIYVRLSKEDQDKLCKSDESESIQNQKSMLVDYCRQNNWVIYDIYNDEDFSGTDKNRPEFNRMISDCREGRIDVVLCKSQSRFSRDAVLIESYLHDKFIEWNVRFKSLVDNVDTEDISNKKSRQVNALVNEWYVEDVSRNVRQTLKHKREQGQFVGSFAPYGYIVDPQNKNHLLVDETAAENVRLIFEMFSEGLGYRTIVKELNGRNVPSPTLYKQMNRSSYRNHNLEGSSSKGLWTQTTVYTILRNENYTGTLVQGKSHTVSYKNHKKQKVPEENWVRVPDTHEAIIDKPLWEKVQRRLKSRIRAGRVTNELSPLSGMVKCAVCGKPMKRNIYYNKARTIQYYGLQCASYKIGAMNCENTRSISGLKLEEFLVDEINRHISKYCDPDSIDIVNRTEEELTSLNYLAAKWTARISDKENKITRAYEDYLDGLITADQYRTVSSRFTDDISAMKDDLEEVQTHINEMKNTLSISADRRKLLEKYIPVKSLTRQITEEFIDTVYIGTYIEGQEREITINWKI